MDLKDKTVLVTGGAGFIGSHLVDALSACRAVRILDDLSTGRVENVERHLNGGRVHFLRGDIRDGRTVRTALEGVDVVFHLATRGVRHSIGNPTENHEVNAAGTLMLLGAAQRAKVLRFIHVSTSEVYGTARYTPMDEHHPCFPETIYGAAKLAGEAYARAYYRTNGLPTVVVRPFNNFGPRSHHEGDSGEVIPRFAVWALNGKPPVIFGDGKQTRDFLYVADTAHWLCRVADCDTLVGRTINLGSGRETSILELASLVYKEAGRPDLKPIFEAPRPGDVLRHLAGAQLAIETLGFQTRTSVGAGVRQLLDYLRARPEGVAGLLRRMHRINWTQAA
jgi:UDP-glucose 4-epimerase